MVSKDSVANESSINDDPAAELVGGMGSLWRAGLLTRNEIGSHGVGSEFYIVFTLPSCCCLRYSGLLLLKVHTDSSV